MTWDRGGPAAVVAALARHQQLQGHQVTVLTTDQGSRRGERPIELPGEIEMRRVPVLGPDRIAFAPRFAPSVRDFLPKVDVMHVHSIFRYPCLAAIKAASQHDRPVIIRPCGVLHRYGLESRSAVVKAWFLRRYGSMYKETCGAWHYTSENEQRESWPFECVAGFVVPNGIDAAAYAIDREVARQAVQEKFFAGEAHEYVLFLGRLHRKKRVDLLLEAFLDAAPASHKLIIAGPDESGIWPALERRFLGDDASRERVVRIGLVTGQAKYRLLAGASLFALASEHENFGNVVLESLAAGTPVIGTDHVDVVNELAERGLVHVAPMDLDVWRDQLRRRLADPVSDSFVAGARHFIAENYGWERVSGRLVSEYRALSR